MKNIEVRMMIQESGFKFYQVAAKLGISESYFSRLLRDELTPDWKERIVNMVTKMKGEQSANAV